MWRVCLTSDNILSLTVTGCRICDWTLFTHNMIPSGAGECFINRLGAACYHGYFKGIRLTRVRRNRSRLPAKHSAVGSFTFFPPLLAFLRSHFSTTLLNMDKTSQNNFALEMFSYFENALSDFHLFSVVMSWGRANTRKEKISRDWKKNIQIITHPTGTLLSKIILARFSFPLFPWLMLNSLIFSIS